MNSIRKLLSKLCFAFVMLSCLSNGASAASMSTGFITDLFEQDRQILLSYELEDAQYLRIDENGDVETFRRDATLELVFDARRVETLDVIADVVDPSLQGGSHYTTDVLLSIKLGGVDLTDLFIPSSPAGGSVYTNRGSIFFDGPDQTGPIEFVDLHYLLPIRQEFSSGSSNEMAFDFSFTPEGSIIRFDPCVSPCTANSNFINTLYRSDEGFLTIDGFGSDGDIANFSVKDLTDAPMEPIDLPASFVLFLSPLIVAAARRRSSA